MISLLICSINSQFTWRRSSNSLLTFFFCKGVLLLNAVLTGNVDYRMVTL